MILSILIPSLFSRSESLSLLLDHLRSQITDYSLIEILVEIDNKEISTGAKRNKLVNRATGKYVVFIDDDDFVPHYYVANMLAFCQLDMDCVAINGTITTDGANEIKWRISKDYDNVTVIENGNPVYLRKTNHITAVKRELALLAPFPDKSNAEDKAYSDLLNPFLKTEVKINEPMYWYRYSTKNKEYK